MKKVTSDAAIARQAIVKDEPLTAAPEQDRHHQVHEKSNEEDSPEQRPTAIDLLDHEILLAIQGQLGGHLGKMRTAWHQGQSGQNDRNCLDNSHVLPLDVRWS